MNVNSCEQTQSVAKGECRLVGRYVAENISTEKMLDALAEMRERAHENHAKKVAAEEERYEQELGDIMRFRDMFYCSNYEK